MYNAKAIADFINKVNEEAEKAAEQVFKKYEAEFKRRVLAQMKEGDRLCLVNGSSFFDGRGIYRNLRCQLKKAITDYPENQKPETEAMERFRDAIAQIQYLEQRATFDTYDFLKQPKIKTWK